MTKIKTFFKYLTDPMPLDKNFKDYSEYWQIRGFHSPSLNRARIISKDIGRNKKILDIGCGDGTIIDYISKNNSPEQIIGIDISEYAVEYVKKRGYDAKVLDVLSKDFEKLLKTNNFDYIIITEVLEHIQDPEKVIENIKEYNPNAIIFISIPNAGFIMHRLRLLFGKFPVVVIVNHIKEHIRFWTYSDFKYWIDFFGYSLEDSYVSSTVKLFGIDLGELYPAMFANQIIYKIRLK